MTFLEAVEQINGSFDLWARPSRWLKTNAVCIDPATKELRLVPSPNGGMKISLNVYELLDDWEVFTTDEFFAGQE